MEANKILINITRYIHAKYDHEIDSNAKNLPVLLKKVIEQFDDPVLHEYWNEYANYIGNTGEQLANDVDDSEAHIQEGEGQEDENVEDGDVDEEPGSALGGIRRRFKEYKEERKKRGR